MTREVESHIETMIARVDDAHMALSAGHVENLDALESDVGRLCAQVSALPPAQARDLQPLMGDLIARLDELAGALEDFKARNQE